LKRVDFLIETLSVQTTTAAQSHDIRHFSSRHRGSSTDEPTPTGL